MSLTGWQLAVYEAIRDLTGPEHEVVDRAELVGMRLISIMGRAGSGASDPGQAVSLAAQRLRDKGVVEFVGPGRYRLVAVGDGTAAGGSRRPLAPQKGGPMTEQIVGHRVTVAEDGTLVERQPVASAPRERDVPRTAAPSSGRERSTAHLMARHRERAERAEREFQERLAAVRETAGEAEDVLRLGFVELRRIVPGDLNRHVDDNRSRKMALDFRWRSVLALGVEALAVDVLPMGRPPLPVDEWGVMYYQVREGHHRLAGLRLIWGMDALKRVPVAVLEPETKAKSARTVLDINNNHTRWTVTATQRLAVQAEDPGAVAVAKILARYGLRAQEEGGTASRLKPGEVSGIVALRELLALGGEALVDMIVGALYRGYGTNTIAYRAPLLRGTGDFLLRYWEVSEFRTEVLDRAFQGTAPLELLERAREIRRVGRGKKDEPTAVAEAIFEAYELVRRKPPRAPQLAGFTTESTLRAGSLAVQQRARGFREEHEAGRVVAGAPAPEATPEPQEIAG